MSRVDELKQRLARIPDPDSPEGKKLIDDITDIAMKHRRERIINSPKTGKPYRTVSYTHLTLPTNRDV